MSTSKIKDVETDLDIELSGLARMFAIEIIVDKYKPTFNKLDLKIMKDIVKKIVGDVETPGTDGKSYLDLHEEEFITSDLILKRHNFSSVKEKYEIHLETIVENADRKEKMELLTYADLPSSIVDSFSTSSAATLKIAAIQHENISENALWAIIKDDTQRSYHKHKEISALLKSKNVNMKMLEYIVDDGDEDIAEQLAKHPNLNHKIIKKLAFHSDADVRHAIALREDVTTDILILLALDKKDFVRFAAENNDNMPLKVLKNAQHRKELLATVDEEELDECLVQMLELKMKIDKILDAEYNYANMEQVAIDKLKSKKKKDPE